LIALVGTVAFYANFNNNENSMAMKKREVHSKANNLKTTPVDLDGNEVTHKHESCGWAKHGSKVE